MLYAQEHPPLAHGLEQGRCSVCKGLRGRALTGRAVKGARLLGHNGSRCAGV